MTEQKRIKYLDIARGIAVIAVVVGHIQPSLCPEWLTAWVYSFHLPLFFIISGVLINVKKYPKFSLFAKKTFKSLFVQYLILSLMVFAIDAGKSMLKGGVDIEHLLKQFSGIFISWRQTGLYNAPWFIPAIALSEFIAYPIIKTADSSKNRTRAIRLLVSAIIAAAAGCTLRLLLGNQTLPWAVDLSLIIVAFVLFGQLLRPCMLERLNSVKVPRLLFASALCLLINVISCVLNCLIIGGRSDLFSCVIGNPLLFYISAVSGASFILLLSASISKCTILEHVGARSIVFYAFQTLALPIAKAPVVFLIDKAGVNFGKFLSATFVTVATCIILTVVAIILEFMAPKVFKKPFTQLTRKKQ